MIPSSDHPEPSTASAPGARSGSTIGLTFAEQALLVRIGSIENRIRRTAAARDRAEHRLRHLTTELTDLLAELGRAGPVP